MSVFSTNQVEELIIGNAVATETTVDTFIASASDQEIKVLSADGTAPAAGKDFRLYQKNAGDAAKNLNYEFSDVIKPSKVERVVVKQYAAEVQKSVTATVTSAAANTTYAIECRILNDGGSLSPENFAIVTGYFVTGSTAGTIQAIRDGLIVSLNANLVKRGNSELVVTANSTDQIIIAGKFQPVVKGKIEGRQIDFQVTGKSFSNVSIYKENTGLITTTITAVANPGVGTGKYAVNLEWFTKGFKYEVYRQTGYPADFTERTPQYANPNANYNVIHIKYFDDRISPSLEKQYKVLTILVLRTDLASNAVTNAVLADLRTILGVNNVPSDLATA